MSIEAAKKLESKRSSKLKKVIRKASKKKGLSPKVTETIGYQETVKDKIELIE